MKQELLKGSWCKKNNGMKNKMTELLTLLSCVSAESSQTWSRCQVWSARSATCQNTSGSSAAALSLHTDNITECWRNPIMHQLKIFIYALSDIYSPLTGTPRKILLEMSTTVQRSKLRTSTWVKSSRLSRWICVEDVQTSTVCCKFGPVRADTEWVLWFVLIKCANQKPSKLAEESEMLPLVK